MIAEGGKREEGVEKENRARRRLDEAVWLLSRTSTAFSCTDVRDRKVRMIGKATKKTSRRRSLKGRMLRGTKRLEVFHGIMEN